MLDHVHHTCHCVNNRYKLLALCHANRDTPVTALNPHHETTLMALTPMMKDFKFLHSTPRCFVRPPLPSSNSVRVVYSGTYCMIRQ